MNSLEIGCPSQELYDSSALLYQCGSQDCKAIQKRESVRVPEQIVKYYLRDEVVVHNTLNDFWVILHGNVLDLTIFLNTRQDSMTCVRSLFDGFSIFCL